MAVRDEAIAHLVGELKRMNTDHRSDPARLATWDQAVASMRQFMADHGINVDQPDNIRTLIVAMLAVQTTAELAHQYGHMGADSAYGAQWAATHILSILAEFA